MFKDVFKSFPLRSNLNTRAFFQIFQLSYFFVFIAFFVKIDVSELSKKVRGSTGIRFLNFFSKSDPRRPKHEQKTEEGHDY